MKLKFTDHLIVAAMILALFAGLLFAAHKWSEAGKPGAYHCPGCNCTKP